MAELLNAGGTAQHTTSVCRVPMFVYFKGSVSCGGSAHSKGAESYRKLLARDNRESNAVNRSRLAYELPVMRSASRAADSGSAQHFAGLDVRSPRCWTLRGRQGHSTRPERTTETTLQHASLKCIKRRRSVPPTSACYSTRRTRSSELLHQQQPEECAPGSRPCRHTPP